MVLERSPETAVIMVSNFDDASYRGAARRAGARAFVSKRAIGKELLLAIESVMSEISRCRAGLALARTGTA
jgi:DNA-binding NarL/FixJ family response regulator